MLRYGLQKPKPNAGLPSVKDPLLYLVNRRSVKRFPKLKEGSVMLDGDIELYAGSLFMPMYATPQKQKYNSDTEGDHATRLFTQKVSAWHPGDEQQLFDFMLETNNEGYIILMQGCEGSSKVFGTPDNPMYHQMQWEDSNDGKGANIHFESAFSDAWPVYLYAGKFLFAEPGDEYTWVLADEQHQPILFNDQFLQIYGH